MYLNFIDILLYYICNKIENMKRYKFIKDRTASPKEVFENLKNGG